MRTSDLQPLGDYTCWVDHRFLGEAADLNAEEFAEPSSVTTRDGLHSQGPLRRRNRLGD